jgi:hypothetical protein
VSRIIHIILEFTWPCIVTAVAMFSVYRGHWDAAIVFTLLMIYLEVLTIRRRQEDGAS